MVPLLSCLLAYLSGIFWADVESRFWIFSGLLPFLTLAGALLTHFKNPDRTVAGGLSLALFWILGAVNLVSSQNPSGPGHVWEVLQPGERATVHGVVSDLPEKMPDRIRWRVDLESVDYGQGPVDVHGRASISFYGDGINVQAGDRIVVKKVRLKRPRNFKNPGRFDYERFMRWLGVDVTAGFSRSTALRVVGREPLTILTRMRVGMRQSMDGLLQKSLQPEYSALLKGMVFGDRAGLSQEMLEPYQATGLAHLFAVSGLHIGFVAGAAFFLVHSMLFNGFLRYRPEWVWSGWVRPLSAALCLLPVLIYMLLVGPKVSSIRAGVMVVVFLFAVIIGRERHMVNALAFSALLILIWNPEAVFMAGFQMSFLAVLAIVLWLGGIKSPEDAVDQMGDAPWYRRWIHQGPPSENWQDKVVDGLIACGFITLIAGLATLPLVLWYFHRVSTLGLFLNLLLVPIASLLIPYTLMVLFVGLAIPALAVALLWPLNALMALYQALPSWFAAIPGAAVFLPNPPPVWLLIYFSLLLGLPLWMARENKNKKKGDRWLLSKAMPMVFVLMTVAVVAGITHPRLLKEKPNELQVTFIDVGQGDAIFIEAPNGQTVLIDGGGFFKNFLDVGLRVVGPYLWSEGRDHIDYIAATHSDQDHISGVESVVSLFDIGHYLDRADGTRDPRLNRLRAHALGKGAHAVFLIPGKPLAFGEVSLTLLHPGADYVAQKSAKAAENVGNDLSWILRLDYRQVSILLTGDITEAVEQHLVNKNARLNSQVMKAPHHGSRTSSSIEFLNAVQPETVVVSAGYKNFFNHPHQETLEAYRGAGARVLRTDQRGAIRVVSNGLSYRLEHYDDTLGRWTQ